MALGVHKQLSKAGNFVKNGDIAAAKNIYNQILQIYPENKAAKLALLALEKPENPESNGNASIQDQITNLLSLYNQGELQKVLEAGQQMIGHFPQVEIIHNIVGAAYKGLGRLAEAAACYRQAISINPRYSEAYNNLAIAFNDLGQLEAAVEYYRKAIQLNPAYAAPYNNLGVTLVALGLCDEAIELQKKAISIAPDYTGAYHNLGNSYLKAGHKDLAIATYLKAVELSPNNPAYLFSLAIAVNDAGRLEEAASYYQTALQLNPAYADAYNNLGCILLELERHLEAIESFRKLIQLDATYFKAFNNLGLAQRNLGRHEESVASFKKAIAIEPTYSNAHFNLGIALNDLGHYEDSVSSYLKAIELTPDFTEAKHNLAGILGSIVIEQKHYSDNWANAYLGLLTMPNMTRPSSMAAQICQLLKLSPLLQEAVTLSKAGKNATDLYALRDELSSIPLLLKIMELTSMPDIELENVLTALRSAFLSAATNSNNKDSVSTVQIALALHCFTNEYVFAETESETQLITELESILTSDLANKETVNWFGIATLASYRPLIQYNWLQDLYKELSCTEVMQPIFATQIDNILEERVLRQGIPLLNSVSNETSLGVQQQYEENPYPRWIKTRFELRARALPEIIKESKLRLHATNVPISAAPQILIAGCGTGQHSLLTATRVKNCNVFAIDLSLSSLAYAKRKTVESGITNIEYMQADILDLEMLNRQFDIVESVGVLHHMADPVKGWRVISNCLKPGGLMRLGLYSSAARQSVTKARALIKELGIGSSTSEILKFRYEILNSSSELGTELRDFVGWTDFFTTSEIRDLLFHVQEHQFNLIEIKSIIEQLGLKFVGFEFPHELARASFARQYPDPEDLFNLDAWHEFELANPKSFVAMYQFWLQKVC